MAQRLSRPVALALGIVTVWPLAYSVWFVAVVIVPTFSGAEDDGILESTWFLAAHLGTMAAALGLIVFYCWHAWTNPSLRAGDARIVWMVLIVMVGLVVMPAYWVRWIWIGQRHESVT